MKIRLYFSAILDRTNVCAKSTVPFLFCLYIFESFGELPVCFNFFGIQRLSSAIAFQMLAKRSTGTNDRLDFSLDRLKIKELLKNVGTSWLRKKTYAKLVIVLREARDFLARPDNDFSWSSWNGTAHALTEIDGLSFASNLVICPHVWN